MTKRAFSIIVLHLVGVALAPIAHADPAAKPKDPPQIQTNATDEFKNLPSAKALAMCLFDDISAMGKKSYLTQPGQEHDLENVLERIRNIHFESGNLQEQTQLAGGPVNVSSSGPLFKGTRSQGFSRYFQYEFDADLMPKAAPQDLWRVIPLGGEIRISLTQNQWKQDTIDPDTRKATCTSPQYKEASNIIQNLKLILRTHTGKGPAVPIPVEGEKISSIFPVSKTDLRAKLSDRYFKSQFESTVAAAQTETIAPASSTSSAALTNSPLADKIRALDTSGFTVAEQTPAILPPPVAVTPPTTITPPVNLTKEIPSLIPAPADKSVPAAYKLSLAPAAPAATITFGNRDPLIDPSRLNALTASASTVVAPAQEKAAALVIAPAPPPAVPAVTAEASAPALPDKPNAPPVRQILPPPAPVSPAPPAPPAASAPQAAPLAETPAVRDNVASEPKVSDEPGTPYIEPAPAAGGREIGRTVIPSGKTGPQVLAEFPNNRFLTQVRLAIDRDHKDPVVAINEGHQSIDLARARIQQNAKAKDNKFWVADGQTNLEIAEAEDVLQVAIIGLSPKIM